MPNVAVPAQALIKTMASQLETLQSQLGMYAAAAAKHIEDVAEVGCLQRLLVNAAGKRGS